MGKKNRLEGELSSKWLSQSRLTELNSVLSCESHGPYRAHQAPSLGYSSCPLCNREAEDEYYRDGRRFSYWPGG